MARAGCDVLVVGAGVSGLTTGVCLAEHGLRVRIWAQRPPLQTTSAVAGAVWYPHLVEAGERTARWAALTLAVLRRLAGEPGTGVRVCSGIEASREGAAGDPGWRAQLAGVRSCAPAELPAGFASGWRYAVPLVHMPTYLGYLAGRFRAAGGRLETATVTSLAAAAREAGAGVVANCTGLGAARLAGDQELVPVRGQVVAVTNPGLEEFFIGLAGGTAELAYIFPHGGTAILGGTDHPGDTGLAPYPAVARRILRDCAAIEPRLAGAQVLAHRVGLRPVRPTVRLEATAGTSGGARGPARLQVVHNYGHGGAGVTLSWGCAREAAGLAARERAGRW